MDIKIKWFRKRYILKSGGIAWWLYNIVTAGIYTTMFYMFVIFMFLLG